MKHNHLHPFGWLPALSLLALSACTDSAYDLSDIDTTAKFAAEELVVPINLDYAILDQVLDIDDDNEEVIDTVDAAGNKIYAIRKEGRFLYPGDRDRMAAAYFINRNAAQVILHEAKTTKCHLPIDLYHRHLLGLGKLCYLWCQPTIASQGSFTGLFPSTLSEKTQFMERIIWMCKLAYKKILYNLR